MRRSPDWYAARALAWPLAADGALAAPIDDGVKSALKGSFMAHVTAGLDDPERRLASNEAESAWDTVWVGATSVVALIRHHADRLLAQFGSSMRLTPDHMHPGREILSWRWISLSLPPAILIAAAADPRGTVPNRVDVHDPTIQPRGPLAHLHVHGGAAYSFEFIWAHLAAYPKRVDAADGLSRWIPRALLARRVLAEHVDHLAPLDQCTSCRLKPAARDALRELRSGVLGEDVPWREGALREMVRRGGAARRLVEVDDVWRADPLYVGEEWPEGGFLAACFGRLADTQDPAFEQLFIQMLRVKARLYRELVCDGKTPGLSRFAKYFRAIRGVRGNLEPLMASLAAASEPGRCDAMELRTAPPRTHSELRGLVHSLRRERQRSRMSGQPLEMGWVLHFVRDGTADGATGWRDIHTAHQRRARVLATAMTRDPSVLRHVVALDVAGQEKSGPLWLAVRAIASLRELSRRILARRPVSGARSLRLTLHAGEDFYHLVGGLRAIHEPFYWELVTRGDRLGHALALGWDPDEWFDAHPEVEQPRLERALDLAWLLAVANGGGVKTDGAARERWRTEADALSKEVFGPLHGADLLVGLHRVLGDPALPLRIGLSGRWGRMPSDAVDRAAWALVFDRATRARADEKVPVKTRADRDATRDVATWMRTLLARWQTVIEVNPSSNLVVGGLEGVLHAPMFGLHPHERGGTGALQVSVSADDPLSFATCLADEYAYAWAGLVESGVPAGYARGWIDAAADAAWRARFTAPSVARLE